MNWLTNLMVVLQILAGIAIVGLVLIQQGKGADMGASFGSGSSGSLFGASGGANFMSRSTAVCAAIFFACTLALAFFASDTKPQAAVSVLETAIPGSALEKPLSAASAPVSAVPQPAVPQPAVPQPAAAPDVISPTTQPVVKEANPGASAPVSTR